MNTFTLYRGRAPLLISLPHDGSFIPADIAARMHPAARRSPDTDWHVARLYEPLAEALGASVLKPVASRYVVDLNRPADGHALYPGQRETGLVPLVGFDGEPLYREGEAPDAAEVQRRMNECWQPYHDALAQEINAQIDRADAQVTMHDLVRGLADVLDGNGHHRGQPARCVQHR